MKCARQLTNAVVATAILVLALNNFGIILWLEKSGESGKLDLRPAIASTSTTDRSRTAFGGDNVEPVPRPKLRSIVQGWNISGDASWLLQFSIIGFPKTGTSTLMFHFRTHPEMHMFKDERCELGANQHARLIEDLYRKFPPSNATHQFIRGIKCPSDLESPTLSLRNYGTVFPKTDFIVGVRHPVLWFESFYNFRVHNRFPMPPAETLIGRCKKGWNFVCTYRSNFHIFLGNLAKTNLTTNPDELAYVDDAYRKTLNPVPTSRRIFLYEVSQLSDPDEHRATLFRLDLQRYLHLKQPLTPFIWYRPGKNQSAMAGTTVGSEHHTTGNITTETSTKRYQKINICQRRYDELRSVLMRHSRQASGWMKQYFLHAEGVVVSSKSHFADTVLEAWEHDPCVERQRE